MKDFFQETQLDKATNNVQFSHINYWLGQSWAEDKLTAILWLQLWLKPRLKTKDADKCITQVFELLEDVFQNNKIYDWSTNDWLCVRVLELIPEHTASHNARFLQWSKAASVWQRRSSILAFKKSAKNGQYFDVVEKLINDLLPSKERFVQTGVGWVLSDISRKHPEVGLKFFEKYFDELSHEVITRHTKYLPQHNEFKQRSRERNKS